LFAKFNEMKKIFSLFIILLTLGSCSDDVQFNNESVFQGVKNNEFWQGSEAKATVTPTTLTLQAVTFTETITIVVPLPQVVVDPKNENTFITHLLGVTDNKKAIFTIKDDSGLVRTYETGIGEEDGQVVISEFDGATVSGTFRFNAYNTDEDADEDDFVNFQNGVFYKVAVTPAP